MDVGLKSNGPYIDDELGLVVTTDASYQSVKLLIGFGALF